MSLSNYIRLVWDIGSSSVTHSITDASMADDTLTIAGDHRRNFISGTLFTVAGGGNSGPWTVDTDATYNGTSTIIPVTGNIAADGAGGTITEANKFIEFEFARLKIMPSEPARKVRGRFGTVKRIIPVTTAAKKRYAIGVVLIPHPSENFMVGNSGTDLVQVLYDKAYDADTEFRILREESHYSDGQERFRRTYYKGYVDMEGDADYLGSLVGIGGDTPSFAITFTCHEDGTFTALGNASSISARTRP